MRQWRLEGTYRAIAGQEVGGDVALRDLLSLSPQGRGRYCKPRHLSTSHISAFSLRRCQIDAPTSFDVIVALSRFVTILLLARSARGGHCSHENFNGVWRQLMQSIAAASLSLVSSRLRYLYA